MSIAKNYLHNKIKLWKKIDDNGELKFSAFEIEKWFIDFEKAVKQKLVKSDVSLSEINPSDRVYEDDDSFLEIERMNFWGTHPRTEENKKEWERLEKLYWSQND